LAVNGNLGVDIFLTDATCSYLGRICHYREYPFDNGVTTTPPVQLSNIDLDRWTSS